MCYLNIIWKFTNFYVVILNKNSVLIKLKFFVSMNLTNKNLNANNIANKFAKYRKLMLIIKINLRALDLEY